MRRTALFAIFVLLLAALPLARPYKTVIVDGTIAGDGIDWDSDDLAVDDPPLGADWGPNQIEQLWVTYDSLALYIGVNYQVSNNAMLVLIDALGPAQGASDVNTLDWYPRNFNFPDSVRADHIVANWDGGDLGVRRIDSNTSTTDITSQVTVANTTKANFFRHGEIRLPWDVLYGGAAGTVPAGSKVRIVALIAGGDRWNGPSSAPFNPGMDGSGRPTTLANLWTVDLDRNGDGIADKGAGSIEGTITLADPLDLATVVEVQLFDEHDDSMVDEALTAPGGGPYSFAKLRDGTYRVEAYAPGYARIREPGLVISGGAALTGVDILLTRAGKITGSVLFADGPGAAATVAARDAATGEIGGEGAITLPSAGGPFTLLVPDGDWLVVASAEGYVGDTLSATIAGSDSVHVGDLVLSAVRGTRIVLIEADGTGIESVNTTVSFPDSGVWFYASALVEAQDDAGRRDRYDVEGHFAQVGLRATKLNNVTPPRGDVVFADPADTTALTSIALSEGRGSFLVSDDEIEVLRVFAETATGGISGRFKVGIRSAEPEYFEISASGDRIVADGVSEVAISGRLLDVSGNPVKLSGIPVSFLLAPSSTGAGQYTVPSTVTTADGEAFTSLTATGAGELHATASVTYLNRELAIIGEDELGYAPITAVAGPPAGIELSIPADVVGFGEELEIGARLVDAFGNPVSQGGYTLTFSSAPAGAGSLSPASAPLDAGGEASTVFTAASERNIVQISASCLPSLPVEGVAFVIDEIQTINDPPYPEPDPARQSLEAMDLTKIIVRNTENTLDLRIRFSTTWEGAHLVVLLETKGDAAGAVNDPFLFPVSYAHPLLPDYCFTFKYSSNDYADMRRWSGTEWEWWDSDGKRYISTSSGTWVEGINVQGDWTSKDAEWANVSIPFDFLEGAVPATIRLQVYLTQETDVKRSAFDSAPHDSTLNLDFDPDDPEVDWSVAQAPVTLRHYADPYTVLGDFPSPPVLGELLATPGVVDAGGTVLFTARVTDAGDGIGAVLIDLSPIGGSRYQFMYDEGADGDAAAGDGIYSHRHIVDPEVGGGEYALTVSARDGRNISASQGTLALTVQGTAEPIRTLTDVQEDDHGPNLFGREGLYYLYPTNQVFLQRSFDLEEMTIFETSKIVAGEIIPSLAFVVKIGRHPDPADEGNADWNPFYAGINIQKIDIMIDAFKGGATEGLPNRQNDFSRWDAWDYAIVMEGWYKGVLTSGGQNTSSAWSNSVRKSDRDIILISDYEDNTITGVVSKEALGNPTAEEIGSWDIMVVMTSHDGNSSDNNFGDTRWVNASPSEWQFGGGGDLDRDPNIIDLMIGPGKGRSAGRTQSEMLNYKTDEAVARLDEGLTACYIEMTTFEDQGPPVIGVEVPVDETIPFTPLVNAPLYFTALITDDDAVQGAIFRWRADSVSTDAWMGELAMGYAGADIWSVDLPVEEMLENVPIAPYDSTWNIEFEIEAVDPSGNGALTPLYTMEINRPVATFIVDRIDMTSDFEARAPEGTLVRIPSGALSDEEREIPYRLKLSSGYAGDFPAIPAGARSVNVFRAFGFEGIFRVPGEGGDSVDVYAPLPEFEEPVSISFHYPQYSAGGLDEDLIGVYELNPATGVWVYIGGTVNPYGNLVTARMTRPGTYALLHNPEFTYTPGEVFSGIVFSPNPFSPNGDGLYEETSISFYLSAEATVTIEIYDMDGNRRRILERRIAITAEDTPDARPRRVTGFTWDGRDNTGEPVPYGIYVCRFTVTYQQAAGQRTVRRNAAVAVIR